jgi:hypothetical protein
LLHAKRGIEALWLANSLLAAEEPSADWLIYFLPRERRPLIGWLVTSCGRDVRWLVGSFPDLLLKFFQYLQSKKVYVVNNFPNPQFSSSIFQKWLHNIITSHATSASSIPRPLESWRRMSTLCTSQRTQMFRKMFREGIGIQKLNQKVINSCHSHWFFINAWLFWTCFQTTLSNKCVRKCNFYLYNGFMYW